MIEEACKLYLDGLTGQEISSVFGVTRTTIYRWLALNNIKRRDRSKSRQRYTFNVNYFKTIDSEEKAYWLGFLMADAYINTDRNALHLTLSNIDRNHIEKFKSCINSNHKIQDINYINDRHPNKMSRVSLINKDFILNIYEYGLVNKKTGKEKVPKIDNRFIIDFIRGYFDGDGSISYSKETLKAQFSIASASIDFLYEIKEIINSCLGYKAGCLVKNGNIYVLTYTGNKNIPKILELIYKDKTIYLDRKYRKSLEYTNDLNNRRSKNNSKEM
jgi:intein-encoded DNA endonuclease-like protein